MVAPVPAAASIWPSVIAGGASILSGAFGGGGISTAKAKRQARISRENQQKYDTDRYAKYDSYQARVRDAKAAGLHPLYALGTGGSSGGGGSGFSIPGQAGGGSHKQRALEGVAQAARSYGQQDTATNIVNAQNQASALRILEKQISNDASQTLPQFNPGTQEIEKGRVQTHMTKNPEQNTSILSPMTRFRMGKQKIWLPIEEADQVMEDPAAVLLAAAAYHGNDHINWSQMWLDYSHDHKDLARRNPAAFRSGARTAKYIQEQLKKGRRNLSRARVDPRSPAHAPRPW